MSRITDKDLEATVSRLNRITNQPMTGYRMLPDGRYVSNVGNYHIEYAYGGCKLAQMVNEAGGIRNPLSMGFTTKRECYELIHAFIAGIEKGTK